MKKCLALLLLFALLLPLTACKSTVTVYIPQTHTTEEVGGETKLQPVTFVYEEGWEDKENFTVTYSINSENYTMTVGDKYTVSVVNVGNAQAKSETYYDENGRIIRTVSDRIGGDVEKAETLITYDEIGRVTKQEQRLYKKDLADPEVTITEFTYVDTEDGSKGSYTVDDYSVVERFYNKEGRVLREVILIDGIEKSRTEYIYDKNGCQTGTAHYYEGELSSKTQTTYLAVEVSLEKAQKLPQYIPTK